MSVAFPKKIDVYVLSLWTTPHSATCLTDDGRSTDLFHMPPKKKSANYFFYPKNGVKSADWPTSVLVTRYDIEVSRFSCR